MLKDPRQKRFFKTNDLHELFTYTCIDEASTESSAIFAGTGSEITAKKGKKLDGSYIPNLAKKKKAKNPDENDDKPEKNSDQHRKRSSTSGVDKQSDDYVLGKLFKSKKKHGGQSMIHTALHHDKIVENNEPDYALVEIEAEKIANEAVKALKESRKLCSAAQSGLPNLVGVKFGSKLKIAHKNEQPQGHTEAVISSKSLLDRIRLRNKGIHVDKKHTDEQNEPKQPSADEQDLNLDAANPIDRSVNMSKMIKHYLTRESVTFNKASTEQIVDYFRDKIKPSDTAKFKSVLKQICDYSRGSNYQNGSGCWSLKDEFLI